MEVPFEIKRIDEEKGTFVAYGSTFGNEDLGGDVVVRGAFTKSLEQNPAEKVFMFFNHDSKEIIGEYTSIKEDEHGLLIEGKLFIDDIVRAKETHFLMKIGKIKKFSIGFQTIKKAMSRGRRMLQELKLIEISPVVFPMNTQADLLGVKNMDLQDLTIDEINEIKSFADMEDILRDNGGFSKNQATALITQFKSISDGSESQKKKDKGDGSESQNLDLDEEEELDEDGNPIKPKKESDKDKDKNLHGKKESEEARKEEEKAAGNILDNLISNLKEIK